MLFVDDVLVIDLDDINYRQGKTDMELIYIPLNLQLYAYSIIISIYWIF